MNFNFTLSHPWHPLVILLCAAAIPFVVYFFYSGARRRVSGRYFVAFLCLRILTVLVLMLCIFRPVLSYNKTFIERTKAIVMIDVSKSMSIRDAYGGRARIEVVNELLNDEDSGLYERLRKNHDLTLFAFSDEVIKVADASLPRDFAAEGPSTAISTALQEAIKKIGAKDVSGIILFSDGAANRGDDPVEFASALGLPVFTVGVGAKIGEYGRFCDVAIKEVPHNKDFIVNNTARLNIGLSSAGLKDLPAADRMTSVYLKQGEAILKEKIITLAEEGGRQTVEISFVPKQKGIQQFSVEIPRQENETILENNRKSFTLNITDPTIRVLYVEGVLRSEYKFLTRVLTSDPNVTLTSIVKTRKDTFYQQGAPPKVDLTRGLPVNKKDYENFDLVILGDIGREEFSDVQLELLKYFVSEKGGSLIVLGGYHSFGAGGYAGSPLEDMLPVVLGGETDGHFERPFLLKLTQEGKSHPIFEGYADFFSADADAQRGVVGGLSRARTSTQKDAADSASKLAGCNKVIRPKPGAIVLAVNPEASNEYGNLIVLAVQRYGDGHVMALTADTTWKWYFELRSRGKDLPYSRFWGQSVRWITGRKIEDKDRGAQVTVWTDKTEYTKGEEIRLHSRVRNQDGIPEDKAAIAAEVVLTAATKGKGNGQSIAKINLHHLPLTQGEYEAVYKSENSGIHRVKLSARNEGGELGTATADFVVGKPTEEFDEVDLNEEVLKAMATATGGKYYTVLTARDVPSDLEDRRKEITARVEKNLWNMPAFFFVFLACTTVEWVLRKRKQLL